ncbi:hypothetical protein [Prochlorothrix hollandica]|uniref:hypothetical protein n=1 Tax=Prochlorothrix hollandica TaxID=1223 RepID=UPI00333F8425
MAEEPVTEQPVVDPNAAPTDETFANALIPPIPPQPNGLISATDPTARLQSTAAGRLDPFGRPNIPIKVTFPDPPPPEPVAPVVAVPGTPGTPGTPSTPSTPSTPGTPPVGSSPLPAPPTLPVNPPPLAVVNTSEARAIEVTGVVQAGSLLQAIVRSPDELTSRSVKVGQRLANGAVLVKRIEIYGSEPVVVFEQSGVEVTRFVGEEVDPVEGEAVDGATG